MELLTSIQLIIIALTTLYLIYEYSAKNMPLWIKIICFIGWFLCFVSIILVPLDVFYSLGYDPTVAPANNDFEGMVLCWQIVYWTGFIITWLILPILQKYLTAGEFTPKDKVFKAIKANLRTYAAMICCGVVFVVYLKLTGRIGEEGILQFLITFSNCFGLFLIIMCLSNSLVSLPKRCLQYSKQDRNLRAHQVRVALVSDQRQEVLFDIEELIKTIEALLRRKDVSDQDKETLSKIFSEIPQNLIEDAKETIRSSTIPSAGSSGNFTKKQLDALNKKMYRKLSQLKRLDTEWDVTLKRAFFLEDIIESQSPEDWRTKQSYSPPRVSICESPMSAIEWNWHKHISKVVCLVVGILLIGLSILVFFAEILNSYDFHMFDVTHFLIAGGGALAKSQLLCLLPLLYIALCVYSALFRMRIAGHFGLFPHHQTDAPSLIFASLNLSRVTSPMVFNFLQMIKVKHTAFQEVMGNVQFVQSFMKYIPILMVLLILCNAFNMFQRFLTSVGLGVFSFNEEATQEKLEEGRKLMNKARGSKSRSTSVSSFNSRGSDRLLNQSY